MAKFKSSTAIIASKEKMQARLVAAQAELAAAQAREVFNVGEQYIICIGKPGDKSETAALLLGQFSTEKGATKLRFQVGSGMDMRIVDVSPSAVVVDEAPAVDAEGKAVKLRSSAVVASIIKKLEDRLESFDADLAAALARETLVVGTVYNIKTGRGETRQVQPAMLYAQEQTEAGTKLRFFLGEGFDAKFIDGGPSLVVLDGEEDEVDTSDADVAAMEAAAEAEAE